MEIRIESVNKDNSHSWVSIFHGLNKLATDLIDKEYDDNEQETSTTKTEEFAFASRSQTKDKPRRPSTTCSSSRIIPILERIWIDIEPRAQFDQAYPVAQRINTLLRHGELPREEDGAIERLKQNQEDLPLLTHLQELYLSVKDFGLILSQELIRIFFPVSKRLTTLLRHGHLYREEDGAIEFWRLKGDLQNKFESSQYWSGGVRKSGVAGGGGNKKRFQCCTDSSRQEILYLRALQGHSGRRTIFFEYIHHIGCAVNLHSITNSGLIPGGENSSKDRQTVFFTAVNPTHMNHQYPIELDLILQAKVEKAAGYVCCVDIQLAQRKGLKFYQTRSNAVILNDTLQAYCISKAIVMKSDEIIYKKVCVCHLDHRRRFSIKIIGRVIWILMLQEAVKTSNESN